MKILSILGLLVGIWFLASAATENGLLPSGHGMGRLSEVIIGLMLIAGSIFRLRTRNRSTA
jgi:hypothetical protein